jgi:membrane fusion protein, multidrug efflux system
MKNPFVVKESLYSMLVLAYPLILISACTKHAPADSFGNPVAVNVVEVKKEKISYYNHYPATVVALNEVEIRTEVNGFVTGIFFKEGGVVRKGDKLYEIDRSRYYASYAQAKAGVDIARANLERARRDADRYMKLNEQDAIAKQRVDDSQTDLENAKLQLVAANAGLVKAENDLSYSLIKAPFDGTIGISQVKLGALVNAGQTLLNTISSDNPMGVDFVLNEKEIGGFQEMVRNKIRDGDSIFRISLADNSLYPHNGKFELIDRAVDPQTGTVRGRLVFPNTERKMIAGMSCTVHILNSNTDKQVVIPLKAILEQMSENFVFLIDSQKVHQTKVSLGARFEGLVIIKEGLVGGEKIVTDGIQKLRDGAFVFVDTNASSPAKN